MKNYYVKLQNLFDDDKTGTYARIAKLNINGKSVHRLVKVSSQNIDSGPADVESLNPINEVFLTLKFDEIKEMDNDNEKRDLFERRLKYKTKASKINIPFVMLEYQKVPSALELRQALLFLVDVIYNNERIDVAVPPKVILPDEIKAKSTEVYLNHINELFEIIETYSGKARLSYFIPAYITRSKIPKLIDLYTKRFGAEGLLILDVGGGRFQDIGYSIVSQVMYNMCVGAKTEDYAIYLFNHKGRKKSGKEVPSEDLLSLLRGVSFVGPSHKRIPLPQNVVMSVGKIFNRSDFLYYPLDNAPNASELQKFTHGLINQLSINKFNDLNLNKSAIELSKDPITAISEIGRPQFKETLAQVSRNMKTTLEQKGLETFL
ncbi:MAG: hypothetical protein H5T33_05140 [Candidatus Methanosuratus sp.]|nr:hypothetical protein [Candidatus Methanosuratincola sp.]